MSLLRSSLRLLARDGVFQCLAASYSATKFTDIQKIMKEKRMKRTRPVDAYLLDLSVRPSEVLSKLTPHDRERLQRIREEHAYFLKLEHKEIPHTLNDGVLVELLRGHDLRHRLHVYKVHYQRQVAKEEKKRKAKLREAKPPIDNPNRIRPRALRLIPAPVVRHFGHARLFRHMDFAQRVILDMSFEDEMRIADIKNLCRQIVTGMGVVAKQRDPVHLVFSGLKRDSNQFVRLSQILRVGPRVSPNAPMHALFSDFDEMPFSRSDECVLESMTPAERRGVVYLTPDSLRVLRRWDDRKTYVVGGLVDKLDTDAFTLWKAKQLGVRHARLPLTEVLEGQQGRTALNVDVVLKILVALKMGADFREAFECISSYHTADPLDNRDVNFQ